VSFDPVKVTTHDLARLVVNVDLEPCVFRQAAGYCLFLNAFGAQQILHRVGHVTKDLNSTDHLSSPVAKGGNRDFDRCRGAVLAPREHDT